MSKVPLKIFIVLILSFFYSESFSQLYDFPLFQLFAKGGISAGGSKVAKFSSGNQSKILFDPSFGGGLIINFSNRFQIVAEAIYLKKGVNCRIEYNDDIEKIYNLSAFAEKEIKNAVEKKEPIAVVWSKNDYLEFPLTVSYTYCKGLFRTRAGAYFAYAVRRRGEFMIIEKGVQSIQDLDKQFREKYVRRHDLGLKLINEFFMDHYSISLECSSGIWPVIDPKNINMNRKSYNMAVSIYFNLFF